MSTFSDLQQDYLTYGDIYRRKFHTSLDWQRDFSCEIDKLTVDQFVRLVDILFSSSRHSLCTIWLIEMQRSFHLHICFE
jgi:hypothetical protein